MLLIRCCYFCPGSHKSNKLFSHTINVPLLEADLKRCLAAAPGEIVWLPKYDKKAQDPVPNRIKYVGGQRLVLEGLWLGHFGSIRRQLDQMVFLYEPFDVLSIRLDRHSHSPHIKEIYRSCFDQIIQNQLPLADLVLGSGQLPVESRTLLGQIKGKFADDRLMPVEWWIAQRNKNSSPKFNNFQPSTRELDRDTAFQLLWSRM
jgi:hypothetical protein